MPVIIPWSAIKILNSEQQRILILDLTSKYNLKILLICHSCVNMLTPISMMGNWNN